MRRARTGQVGVAVAAIAVLFAAVSGATLARSVPAGNAHPPGITTLPTEVPPYNPIGPIRPIGSIPAWWRMPDGATVCPDTGPATGTRLVVTPQVSCIDQPVSIVVRGLRSRQHITLKLGALDFDGVPWQSTATFQASTSGTVDVSRMPSLGGSYRGTWPMGLVASMQCSKDTLCAPWYSFQWPANSDFLLTATDAGGRVIGTTTFKRALGPPLPSYICTAATGTANSPLYTSTLYYQPSNRNGCQQWQDQPVPGNQPVILAIGGAGESVPYVFARALVSHGFPVYALAYYGGQNLPHDFVNIPIKFFQQAFAWLQQRVGPNRPIIVYGYSRGSEAAQLLATKPMDPTDSNSAPAPVKGMILASPSSVANGCNCPGNTATPTWSYAGGPVETNPTWNTPANPPWWGEQGTFTGDTNINGPAFIVCGTADSLWMSCPYSQLIVAHWNSNYQRQLEVAPNGGHFVGTLVPYEPIEKEPNAVASEKARELIWPELLAFLDDIPPGQ